MNNGFAELFGGYIAGELPAELASAEVLYLDVKKEEGELAVSIRPDSLLKKELQEVILTTSELTATGAIEALCVLGYSAEQIHVITLGEEHWNRHTCSRADYSAVRPAIRLGTQSAELLMRNVQSPLLQESEQLILPSGSVGEALAHVPAVGRSTLHSKLRILMLDTPFVHSFCSLLRNFEVQTGIEADVHLLPHHNLYGTILESAGCGDSDAGYDVYMYDMPWVALLASQGVLADLTDAIATLDPAAFLPGCLTHFGGFQNRYYGLPFLYAP